MTTLQKTIITATIAILAGTGIYEAQKVVLLQSEVESLQHQTPLVEHMQKLQSERDAATKQIAEFTHELAEAQRERLELLMLRGEVGALHQQTNRLGRLVQALSAQRDSATVLNLNR